MNHMFVMLTVLAYLLSMGLYMSFLYTGKEVTGRLATVLMFMGLACHYLALLGRARETHKHQHGSETPGNLFSGVEKAHVQAHAQEISQHGQHHEHMVHRLESLPRRGAEGACPSSRLRDISDRLSIA